MAEAGRAAAPDAAERRVADLRRAAAQRPGIDTDLALATALCELAEVWSAAGSEWAAEALEPAREAVLIRLHWLTAGQVSARFAGEVTTALRLFERLSRTIGRRELATDTIRQACRAYYQVAQQYPAAAGVCADGLSKCGVWLCRLDPQTAVAASTDAVRIRAGLFAADPDQAGRYLASLNMFLRTLTIGRSRKQALATYRERYAAWTTPEMTTRLRETAIDELEFTGKTHAALVKLDCPTLERAGYLTQQQILYQTDGDLTTIEEINWKLGLVGLKPLAAGALADPPSKPMDIATSYGALAVRCTSPDAVVRVRAAVVAAYAADGAHPVDSSAFAGVGESHWHVPDPEVNERSRLGDDVVLIRASGNWVAVLSLFWELTPTARHPLALRLSRNWPVLAVNTIEHVAYELCWYADGSARQYAALGRPAGQVPLDTALAPLDFATLADCGADYASETQVRAAFGNSDMFAKLTDLPARGIRQAAQERALVDYGEQVLFFRGETDG
ncbi:MAG: hypothetical protein J2P18_07405 [Nocardia sp.]|nr:hypothetical protein [Nocardia sp.]